MRKPRYGTVRCGMVWFGMEWYGMVKYGLVRMYGMVKYGMTRYGKVWYGTIFRWKNTSGCRKSPFLWSSRPIGFVPDSSLLLPQSCPCMMHVASCMWSSIF